MSASLHSSTIRNVVYIHTHDMGRYIGPYGYDIATLHLRSFAENATLFRHAFCCAPTCSPSRAALLTGVTPHEAGMLGLAHRGFALTHPEQHLAAYLSKQGFLTTLAGIQHEFASAAALPYEYIAAAPDGPPMSSDKRRAQAAVEFLERRHDRPFFLSCGFGMPHRGYAKADYSVYRPDRIQPPAPLPDIPVVRRDMADYHNTVNLVDACIGSVLDALKRTGLDQNTLVIVTTDHGIAFPHMKCCLTDHGIGVTLMMAYPGNPSAGVGNDALVSHLDVYPTICDLLNLPPPSHLQGRSLRPLFEKTADSVRDEVFAEVTFHAAYEPMRAVRTDRYKLIVRYETARRPLSNCDNSPSKTALIEAGWRDIPLPPVELYDLLFDPNEACNLADEPRMASVRRELEARLNDWMRRTHDPLLAGHVPRPPGAIVNTVDSVIAHEGPYEPDIASS